MPEHETAQPLSVWPTAQRPAREQRRGRYIRETNTHPGKMLPAIAARAIITYTEPGELVLDPMCGIGTTLVEAAHLGRHSVGVEYESHWAELARASLAHAHQQGATGDGRVVNADARHVARLRPELRGQVGLLLTSPPYGSSTHGHVRSTRDSGQSGISKCNHRYGKDRVNLAHRGTDRLLAGFTGILASCRELVRPGGIVAITTRPFRRNGELVDFPSRTLRAASAAGFEPHERLVALLAGLRGDQLVPRPSFFALNEARKARARGQPRYVTAHEDVLVLRRPAIHATVTQLRPASDAAPDSGLGWPRAA